MEHDGWDRAAARRRLAEAAARLERALPEEAVERLLDLCALLAHWAGRISLTAHRTPDSVLDRLVLDALALRAALPALGSLADIGSGAGFPGLPVAVLDPDCRVTLVEARERKHHFQRAAVRRLGLGNVRARLGRAEALEPEPHALALAQAVGAPETLLPWLLRWAAPGGLVGLPGGARAPEVPAQPGVEPVEVLHYQVPLTGVSRTLWLGRRCEGSSTGPPRTQRPAEPCGSLPLQRGTLPGGRGEDPT